MNDKSKIESFEQYLARMVEQNQSTDNSAYLRGYLAALNHVKKGFKDIVRGGE